MPLESPPHPPAYQAQSGRRLCPSKLDAWNESEQIFKDTLRNVCRTAGRPYFPREPWRRLLRGEWIDSDKVYSTLQSTPLSHKTPDEPASQNPLSLRSTTLATPREQRPRCSHTGRSPVIYSSPKCSLCSANAERPRGANISDTSKDSSLGLTGRPTYHSQVIAYDKALRQLIAESSDSDIAFNGINQYSYLLHAFVNPLGAQNTNEHSPRTLSKVDSSSKRRA